MNALNLIINPLKICKGTDGYVNKKKVFETAKTIVMFGVSLAIYFMGLSVLGTNKSIWSIIAVLGILPASKCAVGMIMFWRFKSLNNDECSKIKKNAGDVPVLYELIFTTKEKAYYVKSCGCCANTIILFLEPNKSNKTSQIKELDRHINDSLDREGIKGFSVKTYTDLDSYCARLAEMNSKIYSEEDSSFEIIYSLFLAITL